MYGLHLQFIKILVLSYLLVAIVFILFVNKEYIYY